MNTEPEPVTVEALLAAASRRLEHSDTPRLDAEVLLSKATGRPRSHFFAWPDREVPPEQLAYFDDMLARRAAGEPVAYITGEREFWSLPLRVTPDTLIPRPETETLVALALEKIPPDNPLLVADLGTGSGAVALAIASERPACRLIATDHSAAALDIARQNAARLGIGNIEFRRGDWCEPLAGEVPDIVVSNPPYIEDADRHLGTGDVRFEPRGALAAGADGMDALGAIAQCAYGLLTRGGWLLMEHGYNQADAAAGALQETGFEQVRDDLDDSGLPRVVSGRKP